MPKIIRYPRTNFQKTMELVLKLNPETISFSYQEIAEQSQESLSGVLITSIGSAVKYDLLEVRDGRVYWSLLGGLITKNKDDTNLVIKSFLSQNTLHLTFE